ncbi:contactin 1 [Plakobranchus ocellatus]|uniref:Contactin 1 n=1 Tax=Plakobranchus ocellatus TaxID=259542 RepID=A0AAV3ZCK0_9GAST|nr:contactin 1 [Plakobranchus ocellatus]
MVSSDFDPVTSAPGRGHDRGQEGYTCSASAGCGGGGILTLPWRQRKTSGLITGGVSPPAEPAGVYIEHQTVQTTSLVLKWTQGDDRGSPISHYIIEAANAYEKDNWEIVVAGPPAEPAGVYIEHQTVQTTSLVLKWTQGDDRGSPISHYIIEAANAYEKDNWEIVVADLPATEAMTEEKELLSVRVGDLNPGCSYRFRVIAVNRYGLGPPSLPSSERWG